MNVKLSGTCATCTRLNQMTHKCASLLTAQLLQNYFQTRVVKAPFFKANLKAVSKRLIKAVKRLLYVVNMMNDCFKMHYTSVHLVVSNRHHDKTIEP